MMTDCPFIPAMKRTATTISKGIAAIMGGVVVVLFVVQAVIERIILA